MIVRIPFGGKNVFRSVGVIEDCTQTFLCACFAAGSGQCRHTEREFLTVIFRQTLIRFHGVRDHDRGGIRRDFCPIFHAEQYGTVFHGIGKKVMCIKVFALQCQKEGPGCIGTGIGGDSCHGH